MAGEGLRARLFSRHRGASPSERPFTLEVEIEVPPGITILFGPSGAGKSTVLAAIAGLIRPESGRIESSGEIWFDSAAGIDRPVHQRKVGMVFQSLALFPHLTALGNVEYGIDRALPRPERRQRAQRMLEQMKVPHLADRKPSTYSGGEAQRVALARAFAAEPRVVLLDEAFSAMDRELRKELGADVRRWVEEAGVPAIQVTHHRNEARAMGARAILIADGRIVGAGEIDRLLDDVEPGPVATRSSP
jgi:molybdate transport system ATP-binding protein